MEKGKEGRGTHTIKQLSKTISKAIIKFSDKGGNLPFGKSSKLSKNEVI